MHGDNPSTLLREPSQGRLLLGRKWREPRAMEQEHIRLPKLFCSRRLRDHHRRPTRFQSGGVVR